MLKKKILATMLGRCETLMGITCGTGVAAALCISDYIGNIDIGHLRNRLAPFIADSSG